MALDQLGNELGARGKNVRYRSFFLLDRTRATGFNPYDPGDFRDLSCSAAGSNDRRRVGATRREVAPARPPRGATDPMCLVNAW